MSKYLFFSFFFVCTVRPLPAVKQQNAEDGCEDNEDSDYMTPSSLPVLSSTTPTLGEAVPRPHHPSTLNSRSIGLQVSTLTLNCKTIGVFFPSCFLQHLLFACSGACSVIWTLKAHRCMKQCTTFTPRHSAPLCLIKPVIQVPHTHSACAVSMPSVTSNGSCLSVSCD